MRNRTLLFVLLFALSALARAEATGDVTPATQVEKDRESLSRQMYDLADGLEHDLNSDDVKVAEALYRMERSALGLLVESGSVAYPSGKARDASQDNIRALVGRILRLQERVQTHAIETLDRVLPGEPGQKLSALNGKDLYGPLFRRGTPQPGQHKQSEKEALAEMQAKSSAKGITKNDFTYLTRRAVLKMASGKLAEWTQRGKNRVRFTTAGAKHPEIAASMVSENLPRLVRGAGSFKVYKDPQGEVLLVVVSNSSGNYKPGAGATEGVVQKFMELGIPESRVLVTSVSPEEPALVSLLMKSKLTISDETIKARAETLRKSTTPKPRFPVTTARPPRSAGTPRARVPLRQGSGR